MKKYSVVRTDTADALLHRIILGISENFGTAVALDKLDDIERKINALKTNPELGVEPRYMILKRQGYRALILEKNLVFYKIDYERQVVTIYAVVDQRQDYLSIIRGL